ncbi:hypothetical protein GYA49_04840 [Candidatus Beckwithbacteria bacterium]|nr:hypothetical protein [Candidatus Beckwithbacteria bacterium]
MKIYLVHAKDLDYQKILYKPIIDSELWQKYIWTLPYLKSNKTKHSKEIIKEAELIVAEVSLPSTGMGIELGWAEMFGKLILCLHQTSSQPSRSLYKITDNFIAYSNSQEMLKKLEDFISQVQL